MSNCKIGAFNLAPDGHSLIAEVEISGRRHRLTFRSAEEQLSPNLETLIAVLLFPAMKNGFSTLIAQGSADALFLQNLERIQSLVGSWKPNFKKVQIEGVTPLQQAVPAAKRTALFFSGGIDSFYSLLTAPPEVSDLLFVHGFDSPLTDKAHYERVLTNLHTIAGHFGKGVVIVENNIRSELNRYLTWGMQHGAGMAALCYLLFPSINRFIIPTSHGVVPFVPWGSHPELDPLWSGTHLEIIHDRAARRLDKVKRVAESEFALEHLRVCFERPRTGLNCGRCEKCLRTLINLRVVGALDRCPAFQRPLDLRKVARIRINPANFEYIEENLLSLQASGSDPELADALRTALARSAPSGKHISWLQRIGSRIFKRSRW